MSPQRHLRTLTLGCLIFFGVWMVAPLAASAQSGQLTPTATSPAASTQTSTSNCGAEPGTTIANPLKVCSITDLLSLVLKAVIQIGAVILTLALIWTGFKFVMAQGNPEAIKSARTALMWTIIGGLILLGAQAIQLVIQSTVNAL